VVLLQSNYANLLICIIYYCCVYLHKVDVLDVFPSLHSEHMLLNFCDLQSLVSSVFAMVIPV
jgi:hypothetical protein